MLFRTGEPQIAVVDDKGEITFKDVVTRSDEGAMVSIVAGLEDGGRVALNLSSQIVAGAKVKSQEMPEKVATTTPTTATK